MVGASRMYLLTGSLTRIGVTIFNDTAARARAGNFLHVPTLSGTNKNEADLHIVTSEQLALNKTLPYLTELLADVTTLVNDSLTFSFLVA